MTSQNLTNDQIFTIKQTVGLVASSASKTQQANILKATVHFLSEGRIEYTDAVSTVKSAIVIWKAINSSPKSSW